MADSFVSDRTEAALDPRNTVKGDDAPPKSGDRASDSLLEMDEAAAAKQMLKDWDDSWKPISRYTEQWKANRARSQGFTGVQLIKKQDRQQAYIPPGAKKGVAGMNKAARLTRRVRSAIFADPPEPEAIPSSDADEDRDAAEMSTRVLMDLCAEGNLAYTLHAGDAFDLGSDYGSGFVRFWVDGMGGGWKPKQIEASPHATRADDPFPVDPETGAPATTDPILRFVTEDGQFTEERGKAARQWLPKLRDEVLSGKQVRFLPYDVRDLWEADGVMVGTAITFGEFRRIFPEVADWDEGRKLKLLQARPQHFNDILEPHQKDVMQSKVDDRALVFVLSRYHVQSAQYPEGAYLIAAGKDELLHRSEWFDQGHGTPLDIPITQFKQFTDEGNPYGGALMTELGPGNELRGSMWVAMLEHLRRFQNRLIFLPMTSPIQPQQFQSPTGTPIPILPGGEPKYEEIPDFPAIVEKMQAYVSQDMDDESGLQQAGQALMTPNVKSAKHQEVVLQQVAAGLSDLRQNVERGLIRGWRIMLQLVRCYYTIPQQIGWEGDDGRYKQRNWSAADLGSTRDVRIQRGTFTQMVPQQKASLAAQYHQLGILSPFDLEHVVESSVGAMFGLQDNPHRLRVRRQIAQWKDGPPQDFVPQLSTLLPQGVMSPAPSVPAQQPPVGPVATGSAVAPSPSPGGSLPVPQTAPPPPPNPFAPILSKIFAPIPADSEPQVALLRMYELGRAMASTKFEYWPPAWNQGLTMAYELARQAAQIPDAKMLQALQTALLKTKQQLAQSQAKLQEAHVSFTGKLADMDQTQTQAILAQDGIVVPPHSGNGNGDGKPDPLLQMAHERAMHEDDLAAQSHQTRIKATADLEKERIRAAAKAQSEEKSAAREAMMLRRTHKPEKPAAPAQAPKVEVKPEIHVHVPPSKGHKVIRGKDGKIEKTEPIE